MSFTIRHAHPDDARDLHAILTSPHVVKGTMRLPHMALKTTEDRLAADQNRLQLVAVSDAGLLGFAELILNLDIPRASHCADLNMVATRDDDQGNGVARALIEELIRLCDTLLGIHRISLTVWVDNTRAIHLYTSLGFEEEGRMRDVVRRDGGYVDALIMSRISRT